ncbi:MAG: GntP family permease [Bacteroidota bacterium]
MNSLGYLVFIVLLAIVFIIVSNNKLKWHPLLALLVSALFVGFASGMDSEKIITLIGTGFGSILSGIGLIVVLGTVIGVYTEKSGALDVIAGIIIQLFGKNKISSAAAFLGASVSIQVFCDSGFIILSKMIKKVARKGGIKSASLSLALAAGLYTTHTLIPPTPGPVVVAGNLGISDQLGIIVLTGILVSVPVLLVSTFLANKLGQSIDVSCAKEEEYVDEVKMNPLWAFTPILVPILLITLASVIKIFELDSLFSHVFIFLGNPFLALLIGVFLSMIQVYGKCSLQEQQEYFKKGIEQAGPIVLITGAGSSLGNVLKGTAIADHLSLFFHTSDDSFFFLSIAAFLITAFLKTAQGSSTSALVIGGALIAPVVASMEGVSTFQLSLLVMSLGGGAMTVSHANDSYFWVVTQFSGFRVRDGYKGLTLITLVQGLTTLATVLILYWLSLLL